MLGNKNLPPTTVNNVHCSHSHSLEEASEFPYLRKVLYYIIHVGTGNGNTCPSFGHGRQIYPWRIERSYSTWRKETLLPVFFGYFTSVTKLRHLLDWKTRWNRQIIVVPATVWQVLSTKCVQWPETEIYSQWIERSHSTWRKEVLFPVFFGYFIKSLTKARPNPNHNLGSAKQQLVTPFFKTATESCNAIGC